MYPWSTFVLIVLVVGFLVAIAEIIILGPDRPFTSKSRK